MAVQIRWKLMVVLLLLDSYILSKAKQQQDPDNVHDLSAEQLFYSCFVLTIIGNTSICDHWSNQQMIANNNVVLHQTDKFLLFALLCVLCVDFRPAAASHQMNCGHIHMMGNIIKSITLASITRFFLLPIIIWHSNTTQLGIQLHDALVGVYFMIALAQIYSSKTIVFKPWKHV